MLARYGPPAPSQQQLPSNPCEQLTCPPEASCQLKRSPSCLLPLLPCHVVGVCSPALPTYSLDRREEEPSTLQVIAIGQHRLMPASIGQNRLK